MNYYVKITDEAGKSIAFGDDGFSKESEKQKDEISNVIVYFDTVNDDAKSKNDSMIAKINITGPIKNTSAAKLIELFNWSIDFKANSEYRTVEIRVYESQNLLRTYIFERMFVVDYKETYVSDQQGGSKFELHLNQEENNLKTISSFD